MKLYALLVCLILIMFLYPLSLTSWYNYHYAILTMLLYWNLDIG
jgi:hypothetical protein